MPTNNNTAVSERLRNGLKINQATEEVPTRVAESIVPVFEVSPKPSVKSVYIIVSDSSANSVIHTCHATKKTFLLGGSLTVSKSALSDSIQSDLIMNPVNCLASRSVIQLRYEPLTALSNINQGFYFPFAIELRKGSQISMQHGSATASIDGTGIIFYYEED